jgi:hypothetical protein
MDQIKECLLAERNGNQGKPRGRLTRKDESRNENQPRRNEGHDGDLVRENGGQSAEVRNQDEGISRKDGVLPGRAGRQLR